MQLTIQPKRNWTEKVHFEIKQHREKRRKKVVQHHNFHFNKNNWKKESQHAEERRAEQYKNNERKHEKNEMKMSILFLCIFSSTIETEAFFPFPSSFAVVSSNPRALLFAPHQIPTRTTLFRCRLIYHLGWWFCLMLRLSFSPPVVVVVQYTPSSDDDDVFFIHYITSCSQWLFSRVGAIHEITQNPSKLLERVSARHRPVDAQEISVVYWKQLSRAASRTISRSWNGRKKMCCKTSTMPVFFVRKLIFLHASHGWVDWKGWLDLAILLQIIRFCAEWNPNGV